MLRSVKTPPAAGHRHHLYPETLWWPLAGGDSTGTALMAPGTCLESHLAAPLLLLPQKHRSPSSPLRLLAFLKVLFNYLWPLAE